MPSVAIARPSLPMMPRGLVERLTCMHDEMKGDPMLAALNRIAVTLYDHSSDLLKSFIHSSDGDSPMERTVARLSDIPVLQTLATTGARRTVNDLTAMGSGQDHSSRLVACGYRSSYTVPMRYKGVFYGFLFLNSFETGFFTPEVIQRLRAHVELISLTVMREMDTVRMMQAAVTVIRQVSSARDEETASHLARMARYARLVATRMAPHCGFDDEFIEFVFQFCPLHDVGKVAVPDSILLKPGRLDEDELTVMRSHVGRGVDIVEMMLRDFGLGSMPHVDLLRNIVAYHHEAMDGSGYPHGLAGKAIPIEARIAAVADVFDALTSRRPYKEAWTNADALDLLRNEAGRKFDADCVAVMLENVGALEEIQLQFRETMFG